MMFLIVTYSCLQVH